MNMKQRTITITRVLALLLTLTALAAAFTGCAESTGAPDGYEYATCTGEYFRLFTPTGWQVNTESGVSGAYITANTHVTMEEVYFDFDGPDTDTETAAETAAETEAMAALPEELRAFVTYHTDKISQMQNYTAQKAMVNTLGGYPAWDITYEAKVGTLTYRFRQLLTTANDRYFVFTYSSTADQAFDLWLDQIDGVIGEVVFTTYPYEGEYDRKIPEDPNTPEGMQRVSTDEVIYRFYAPSEWIIDQDNGHSLVYASETDRSNVSVMSYLPSASADVSVESYKEATVSEYKNNPAFENFTVVSEDKEQKLGGAAAVVCEFSYTMGDVHYRCRQVFSGYRGMVYVMTYTATADLYETHLDEAVAMQNALTFQ